MSESPEAAQEALEKISHMLQEVEEVPEAFSELVELVLEAESDASPSSTGSGPA